MGTDLFCKTLFRLPTAMLTSGRLEHAGERLNYEWSAAEIARDYTKITEQINDLAQRVEELAEPDEDT